MNTPDIKKDTGHSPKWGGSTKAMVAFIFFGVVGFFLVRFRALVGPLLLAFLLSYLLYPAACWLVKKIRLPWGLAVAVVLLVVVLILLGLLTWGGIALVDQSKGLLNFLQNRLNDLPEMLENLNEQVIVVGPFEYPLSNLNLNLDTVGQQIVSSIQPLFSQVGSIVTSIASGAASLVTALFLVIMLAYFILLENRGRPYQLFSLHLPGYEYDLQQIGLEMKRIWHGFLRGQLTMVSITFVIYFVLLNILGVRFALGLAVMAGFARFIPWVGTAVTWFVYFVVALLQTSSGFGLQPFPYALVVIGVSMLMDPVIDSMITPRVMGNALRVHPAMLLVGIIIGTTWLGFIGLVLAGPVLATVKLLATFALHKLFDMDPWESLKGDRSLKPPAVTKLTRKLWDKIKDWGIKLWERVRDWFANRKSLSKKDKDDGKHA
ncbi:MAG: AI-2E family transporter [Anaerolineaceae bacterium]|nr:AI-2E family transporter [Anaerolineaceae bacterium]